MTRFAHAAVFVGPGRPFELHELSLPQPQDAEVLVAVTACTLCGSDLHTVHGRRTVPLPSILGHEILGRVAALGSTASHIDAAGQELRVGDRVTWSIVASCGTCFYCRRDLPQKCERQTKYGHEPLIAGRELTGGLSDYCLLAPGTAIFRVPENLSDAAACPANCATATVAAALEAAGEIAGRTVLLMGAGMLGVTAAAWARAAGAEHIICCDTVAERLALIEQFGGTHFAAPSDVPRMVSDCTSGHGVDFALELTGAPESFELLLPQIRMGGTAVLVGSVFPTRPVPLLLEQVVRRCLTLRGVHNYAPRHLAAALDFLASNSHYPWDQLVAPWQPLDEINRLLAATPPSHTLRMGIRPGS